MVQLPGSEGTRDQERHCRHSRLRRSRAGAVFPREEAQGMGHWEFNVLSPPWQSLKDFHDGKALELFQWQIRFKAVQPERAMLSDSGKLLSPGPSGLEQASGRK